MSTKKKKVEEPKRSKQDIAKDKFRGNHVELEDCVAVADGYYTPFGSDGIAEGASRIVKAGEVFDFHGFLDADGHLPMWIEKEDFEAQPKKAAQKELAKVADAAGVVNDGEALV